MAVQPKLRADAPEVAPALMEARLAWHRLQVKAVNVEGEGALAVYRFATPIR